MRIPLPGRSVKMMRICRSGVFERKFYTSFALLGKGLSEVAQPILLRRRANPQLGSFSRLYSRLVKEGGEDCLSVVVPEAGLDCAPKGNRVVIYSPLTIYLFIFAGNFLLLPMKVSEGFPRRGLRN